MEDSYILANNQLIDAQQITCKTYETGLCGHKAMHDLNALQSSQLTVPMDIQVKPWAQKPTPLRWKSYQVWVGTSTITWQEWDQLRIQMSGREKGDVGVGLWEANSASASTQSKPYIGWHKEWVGGLFYSLSSVLDTIIIDFWKVDLNTHPNSFTPLPNAITSFSLLGGPTLVCPLYGN